MSFLFEILIFTGAGCMLGIFTGLVPGIHINTISAFILAVLLLFSKFSLLSVGSMLIAMAVVHTFLSFIPAILLGAPEAETALSVLPGHKMLLEGRALEAIKLTGMGCILALLFTTLSFAFSVKFIPFMADGLKPVMHLALLLIVLLGFSFEKNSLRAAFIFTLSGIFGFLILGTDFFILKEEMVFPALSGMFGISTLLISLRENIGLPLQYDSEISVPFGKIVKASLLGSFAGMIVGLLPGIGPAQATYVVQNISTKRNKEEFLVANASVNTANIIFTFIVLYTIGKTRSGIVIAVSKIIENFNFNTLLLFVSVMLISGGIAMCLHMKLGKIFSEVIGNISTETYRKINITVILVLLFLVFLLTGMLGIVVLVVGSAIGMLPPLMNVRRSNCMGFLVLPVILFYSGIGAKLLTFLEI